MSRKLSPEEETRRLAEIEAFARSQYQRYGKPNPFTGTPEERRLGRLYFNYMMTHGGYYTFVNSIDLSKRKLPKDERLKLIIERHRKLILEPRVAGESLDDPNEEREYPTNFSRTAHANELEEEL